MKLDLGLNKTVSRLIPTFMRNPRMYQWLMSLVYPLKDINEQFKEFAAIKKKEAQLNSQTKLLEDYLNSTFSPTFPNPDTDRVQIKHGIESAQATFFASELPDPDAGINPPYLSGNMVVYNRAETPAGGKESPFIYFDYEDFGTLPESFRLILPSSIEGTDKHLSIVAVINKYVIDTNRYDIVYS